MSDLTELDDRLRKLYERFDSPVVAGDGWSGSLKWGVLFNPIDEGLEGGVNQPLPPGGGGGGGTPMGACCDPSNNCIVITQVGCVNIGGTYQGDYTECTPNPCPTGGTGACCFSDGTCTVESSADCATAGGTYQGDGTLCSPNPCHTCFCVYPPFRFGTGYYTTRIDNSCGVPSSFSGPVSSTATFTTLTVTEVPCDSYAGIAGSCTCVWDACNGLISNTGEVTIETPTHHCYVGGSTTTCDYQCGEGAPPHIQNTQTLSGQCSVFEEASMLWRILETK